MTRLMLWPLGLLLLVVFLYGPAAAQDQADPVQHQLTREAIRAKLDETRISFKVVDRPFEEVAALLAERFDLPIRLDVLAMDKVGFTTDMSVTLQVENVRLQSLFKLILDPLDLVYRIDRHGLEITTPEGAKADLGQPRFYPVADLVYDDQNQLHADALIELIETTLQPESWEELKGPGTLTFYGGGLVVSQTEEIQRQLGQLLHGLRSVRQGEQDDPLKPITVEYQPGEFETVIQRVRETVIDLPEAEYPLHQLADAIAAATELTVWLDTQELDVVGITTNTPITGPWENTSAERILSNLKQIGLTWKVRDGLVIITTPESAEAELLLRIYPVPDLISADVKWKRPEINRWHTDAVAASRVGGTPGDTPIELPSTRDDAQKAIGSMLEDSIDPKQWEMIGGPGTQAFYPPAQCLVVAQTRPIHDKIEHLLAEIRASQPPPATDEAEDPPGEQKGESPLVVRNYFILRIGEKSEKEGLENARRRILTTIEPESWENEEAYIDLYPGRMVVCQRADIQEFIDSYLHAAGFHGQYYPGSLHKGGGMGGGMSGRGGLMSGTGGGIGGMGQPPPAKSN